MSLGLGSMMWVAGLVLAIQWSLRGRSYANNQPGDPLPAEPFRPVAQMAQRNGWDVTAEWSKRFHTVTVLHPVNGEAWEFSLTTWSALRLPYSRQDAEWRTPSFGFDRGTVIIAAPESTAGAAFIENVAVFFEGNIGGKLNNGLHTLPHGLRHHASPSGVHWPFTLFATTPDISGLPLAPIAELIEAWRTHHPEKDEHPVFTFSPEGLRIRLNRSSRDAALAQDLISLGRRALDLFPHAPSAVPSPPRPSVH